MTAYYNEFDPFAAAWLRELIKGGYIADGEVDERDIKDVQPSDLRRFKQCHFFAGIGGWSLALRLAGWSDDREVWTGSCPCQPFSSAGRQKGKTDDRHLWPVWERLIGECKPATIFGEQVASAIAHGWLDDVYQGLESQGYAVGASVLPACSVGAPHKRDRLWFVGESNHARSQSGKQAAKIMGHRNTFVATSGIMGNRQHNGSHAAAQQRSDGATIQHDTKGQNYAGEFTRTSNPCDVAHSLGERSQGHGRHEQQHGTQGWEGTKRHHWSNGVWIDYPDGKQRLVEPSIRLLADGVSNRVGKLRGYGNAIVPKVAAEFINVFMNLSN
ncbi:MAG: DNA cytosine methyltransferase [Gammaproteobacteria bacterium]|nr:DNA cytosine methyltransferase [Gammaproteobacteria bacterium]